MKDSLNAFQIKFVIVTFEISEIYRRGIEVTILISI